MFTVEIRPGGDKTSSKKKKIFLLGNEQESSHEITLCKMILTLHSSKEQLFIFYLNLFFIDVQFANI